MYEKHTPEQRNGLVFGCRKRSICAIQGIMGNYRHQLNINPFTEAEMETIGRICEDAGTRAKEEFERVQIELADAKASSGTSTESRQYSGK